MAPVDERDRDEFNDADAATAWNAGADAYDVFVESGADYYRHQVHGPALLAACDPIARLRALDLGCGQGFFSRLLQREGARVIGVDIAADLIALARAHEERTRCGIEYRELSAARVSSIWPAGSFDLVASCMAVQDMADPAAALQSAHAVLTPGGRLVFSVPHPATDPPFRAWERDPSGRKLWMKLDRYFETGPAVCDWNMPRLTAHWKTPFRRFTLAEWTRLVREAGFIIDRLEEPRPSREQVEANPRLDDCRRMPFFLIFVLEKTRASS